MIRRITAIYLLIAMLLMLAGCNVPEADPAQGTTAGQEGTSSEETKNLAPDFTVYDLEGNPVKLSDFRGKPVILNFWASWCGPCKNEMPAFNEAYGELADQVHFLMVNLTDGSSETVDSAHAYVQGQGYSFPVYYDTDMDAAGTYGIYSIPMTFFLDAEGQFVAQARGSIDAATLQKGIDMILP